MTGALLWRGQASAGGSDGSSPTVTSNDVFVTYGCGESHDFVPLTGAVKWFRLGTCSGATAWIAPLYNGRLWTNPVDSIDGPLELDATTGRAIGNFPQTAEASFDGDSMFVETNTEVECANASTLAVVWSDQVPRIALDPIIDNGTVFVADAAGDVYGLSELTGAPLWTANAGSHIQANDENGLIKTGMAAANGSLIVSASDHLVAYSNL